MPYESTDALVRKGLIIDLEKEQLQQEQEEAELIERENEVLDIILGKEESSIIRDNESFYKGEKCVFKPYFEGYKTADAIIISITKEKFDSLKEKKKLKIFNRALKKFNKRINKSKKK
jgi:hypothetical protein